MGLRGVNSAKLELYSQSFFPCTVPRRHGSLETFYTTSGRHSEEASTCFFFFCHSKNWCRGTRCRATCCNLTAGSACHHETAAEPTAPPAPAGSSCRFSYPWSRCAAASRWEAPVSPLGHSHHRRWPLAGSERGRVGTACSCSPYSSLTSNPSPAPNFFPFTASNIPAPGTKKPAF